MNKKIIVALGTVFLIFLMLLASYFIMSFTPKSEAAYLENKEVALTQVPKITETCAKGIETENIDHELSTFEYDSVIGSIEFRRLEAFIPILYGNSSDKLEKSLNSGGALDPQGGLPLSGSSTVIAGHKNSDFDNLEHVLNGDIIKLNIDGNTYFYEVYDTLVIDDTDSDSLFFEGNDLAIYTCFPFTYLEHYTQRYVVYAHNISSTNCI